MPPVSWRARRRALAAALCVGAVGAALVVTPTAQAAPGAAAACPRPSAGLPFVSKLTNGVTRIGQNATISDSSATSCGVLLARADGKLGLTILAKNIQFAPVVTKVGLLELPTTLRATSPLEGFVAFSTRGQTASISGAVQATADILGQQCVIPLRVRLTTGTSGPVSGTPFQFDSTGTSRGKLAAGSFAVPAIAPSATCNLVVAGLSNTLLGLPLDRGASTITYDASLKIG